jgi:hypothetical protein
MVVDTTKKLAVKIKIPITISSILQINTETSAILLGRINIEHHWAKATPATTMTIMVLPLRKSTKPLETKQTIDYFFGKASALPQHSHFREVSHLSLTLRHF